MAKAIEAYTDELGDLHHSATDAVLADIATALGIVGEEGGMTAGVARLIFEKRREIERAFADFDRLYQPSMLLISDRHPPANDKHEGRRRLKVIGPN